MRRPHVRLSIIPLSLCLLTSCGRGNDRAAPPSTPPSVADVPTKFRAMCVAGLDSLDDALQGLAALPSNPTARDAQAAYRRARSAYKKIEYWIGYGRPEWVTAFNAPPIAIPDEDDPSSVIKPAGLQLIEAALYPRPAAGLDSTARWQVAGMRRMLDNIRDDSTTGGDSPGIAFDAARTELARIVTLGLAGFDATVSAEGIQESADALRGVRQALSVYQPAAQRRDPRGWAMLAEEIDRAIDLLDRAPDFARFDRFDFLARHYRPLAAGLAALQTSLRIPEPAEQTMWSRGATNIYAAGAIDARWFAPDYAPPPTPNLIELGRQLFFDPALSRAGRRSCATCHQPALAFTDGRTLASVDPGHGRVRNTPTLLNAGLQRHQFADQRVMFLEFQFEQVMANPREMALPHDSAAHKLAADSALVARFAVALGKSPSQALTGQTLSIAVAAYVRSLQALNSRFDRAVAGDTGAITPSERRGFNLFMGKAACATCHFAPLFNGTMPPKYVEAEPEVIGVPSTRVLRGARVDPDPGVIAASRAPLHEHAFKTPTVRNVALTAPYMHNGVFRTLEEVVEFYDRGGGNGIGMKLPNQTLSATPLSLTTQEKRDLVNFLKSLSDSASVSTAAQ